jgi:hypothetical protein
MNAYSHGEIADVIDQAADLIRFNGHWQGGNVDLVELLDEQGDYDGLNSSVCVHLGCAAAVGEGEWGLAMDASEAMCLYLGLVDDDSRYRLDELFTWNDHTPTDEVLDAMGRCAKALREVAS